MFKIMHIITRLDMGGSAQNTLLTCSGLEEKYDIILAHGLSHESGITATEKRTIDSQVAAARQKGVKTLPIPGLVRRIDPIDDLRAFINLLKLIRRERPALVHTHSSKAGILGRLAAKLAGVPLIVHTPHGHVFYGHFGPLASKIFLVMEKIFDVITDRTIALTEGERNDYLNLAVSKAHKIDIIHSGVDIRRFTPGRTDRAALKKQLGINAHSFVVGTVGWLLPIKGPMHLLHAMIALWQKEIDSALIYVGKGDLEDRLKAEALSRGVSNRVIFLGWRSDVDDIMQLFDVFVLPSLNEGMGRVLVEAMAAAKPVVACNVGGIPDLVKHGFNGFLARPGDSRELSVYIEKLLGDELLRTDMGAQGRKLAENYTVDKMIAKIDALYFSLFQDYRI
jgi:glycosyltransferase involved in cell wall biosynthesis